MYAFETSLGDSRVIAGAKALARRAHLPKRAQTYVDRSGGYAHLDPLAAAPSRNAFLKTVLPFLRRATRRRLGQPQGLQPLAARSKAALNAPVPLRR